MSSIAELAILVRGPHANLTGRFGESHDLYVQAVNDRNSSLTMRYGTMDALEGVHSTGEGQVTLLS
jgi:hypothetical protein